MTPEHLAAIVIHWVRWYTRDLPPPVSERRIHEIAADLSDHIEHDRTSGASDSQIVRDIASRMIRGLIADTSWRRGQRRLLLKPEDRMQKPKLLARPTIRVILGVAVILAFPAIATPTGAADWSIGDFFLAGALLTLIGVTIEFAVRNSGNLVGAAAIAALGVAAGFAGEADDAPGLTLIGVLLVASAGLLFVRIRSHAK